MMRRRIYTCGVVVGMLMVLAMPVRADGPGSRQQGAAVSTAATTGPAQVPASKPAPKARADERTYNFGEVMDGAKVEHDFEIYNDGAVVLQILSVRAGCGCTATESDRKIEPGKKGKVHVTFDTRGKGKNARTSVSVQTNDPMNPLIELRMEGSAKQLIEMSPSGEVRFGRLEIDKNAPAKVKVTSNLSKPIKLELMPSGAQADAFKVSVSEIKPGKEFEVTVTPQPPFPEGSVTADLQFATGAAEPPTVNIRASMYNPPAIECLPESIVLGAPPARETPRIVTVTHNGTGEMKVLSASSSDPAIKTSVLEQAAGRTYKVLCQIPAGYRVPPGKNIEIKITTDSASKKEIVVPVTMASAPQTALPPVTFTVAASSLVGMKAPDATIRSFTDRQVKVNEVTAFKVLDFWSMNCPQCMRQLPIMQRLFDQYRAKGFEFLLVNADRVAPLSEVVNRTLEMHLTMPMAGDRDMTASRAYGASALPAMYIISKSGQIEAVHIGLGMEDAALKQYETDITTELDLLLAGKTRADFPKTSGAPADATPVNAAPVVPATPATPAAMRKGDALPDRPLFDISSIGMDLGKRVAGEQLTYEILFRNGGGKPLEITKVSSLSGATINPGYTKTIEPGAAGMIQVGITAPSQPGPFNHKVKIESNDRNRLEAIVTLSGQVRPYIEVAPAGGADFSRRRETHAFPCTVRLTYTGNGPIRFISAESSSTKFEAELRRVEDAKFAELIVRAKPPFDMGENNGVIRVTTDCPQQKVLEVPVKLYMPQRIEVSPAELLFLKGVRRVQKRTVAIGNNGDQPINILAVRRSQDSIKTQFLPEQDGLSYQLNVTVPGDFEPAAGGDRVVIQTDDPEYKEIVIPMSFKSPGQMR